MARIETWLKCDLQAMVRMQELRGDLFTADNRANRIGVIVTDNGVASPIEGIVVGYVIRPDEATVVIEGESAANRAWIDLPASVYVHKGPISIVIKDGNTTIAACHGYMYPSTTEEIVDPGEVIPSISDLLAEIENMREATADARTKAMQAATAATKADSKARLADMAAAKINGMTVASKDLPEGSQATVEVTEVDGHKHLLFGLVPGKTGQAPIDDEAGAGVTDRVWSADKSVKELSSKEDKPDLLVRFTVGVDSSTGDYTVSSDKTADEIGQAYDAGKKIRALMNPAGHWIDAALDVSSYKGVYYVSAFATICVEGMETFAAFGATGQEWQIHSMFSIESFDRADFDAYDMKIVYLGEPTDPQDAATKNYVDTAAEKKIDISSKGAANGVAGLDSTGKVPAAQLPSYVDDVLEFSSFSNFPKTGESGKIYVAIDTSKVYRWSGSTYIEISAPVDISTKADKRDTVLETTLSLGRKEGTTVGINSTALGHNVEASGQYSHAEGESTVASGTHTHAEGAFTTASNLYAHAEGAYTKASGLYAHTEGYHTTSSGNATHAEGSYTVASATSAHAEGDNSTASGMDSHAEGYGTTASGQSAHAEGSNSKATGNYSHAEGQVTEAIGINSHAEGQGSKAGGYCAHAEGFYTIAKFAYQHVFGSCNVEDPSTANPASRGTYIEVVGNGTGSDTANRSNAYALGWNGTGHFAGDVYVNCSADSTGGYKLISAADVATTTETQAIISEYGVSA